MSAAQWVGPVAVAVLAAGMTWVVAPDDLHFPQGSGAVEVRIASPYVLVPAADAPPHDATLLRYDAGSTRHGLGGILDVHAGRVDNGTFTWDGNGWECLRPGAMPCAGGPVVSVVLHAASIADTTDAVGTADAPGADGGASSPLGPADEATVGPDNATLRLTFYMFTSSGHLLATNGLRSQWDHFDLHGEFTRFSQDTWHLGDGPAPPGAQVLPMFRAQAFALLNGTVVGGVHSAVLETHSYDWLVGPVWVTARVDAVV